MKVPGPSAAGSIGAARERRRGADGFAPASTVEAGATSATVRASGAAPLGSLGALLALQQAEGPLERRRRAVRRGAEMLDGLDEVKLALIDGAPVSAVLARLRGVIGEWRDRTDDDGLDGLLDHIDLRAAVELAKRDARVGA